MFNPIYNVIDWVLDNISTKEQANVDLLDPKADLEHFYRKAALYYHCVFYCKIVSILETIYGRYNGDYSKYIPPSERLDDLYTRIYRAFNKIDRRPDFSSLRITVFGGFPDLYGNHLDQLALWERIGSSYYEDIETLKTRPIQNYPLSDDVRLTFFDIDVAIEEHKKKRETTVTINDNSVYKTGYVTLDINQSILQFKDNRPIKISPDNQEIELLRLLLENIDKVVTYETIAKTLQPNAYNGEVTEEVKNAIKMVKKKLTDLLTDAKFKKDAIQSIRGNGYVLNSNKLR